MGQYVITIIGQGPHHSMEELPAGTERDADHLAKELVARLKEAGHVIFDASMNTFRGKGLRDNLES